MRADEFQIVVGAAHPKRECWVICGFDPVDDMERELHAELRRELGFDPCLHSHKLTAKHDADKKSAKRTLWKLTQHDRDRERVCWNVTELTLLSTRGDKNGLAEFLSEIEDRLATLFMENQGQN